MGSDAFLAWSEHWPEVLKVYSFRDKYCDKSSARERKLTHVLTKGLSRLARKKGLEEPRYGGYDFPLKSVPWSYTTTLETIGTDIDTVDWEKSSYGIQDNPDFLPVARRIEFIQKKHARRYFSCCHGLNLIIRRWVDTDLLWLGKGKDFGYILRGYHFDDEIGIELYDILDIFQPQFTYFYPQDWNEVRRRASGFIASEYESFDYVPWALRHILEVADTVLASGHPEKFMVAHDI